MKTMDHRYPAGDFEVIVANYAAGKWPQAEGDSFDCFVVNRRSRLTTGEITELATALASSGTNWVETFGRHAEKLHDAVDEASVTVGRQKAVGDGSPMTAWHEDLESDEAIADYIRLGGHGSQALKRVVVLGSDDEVERLSAALEAALGQPVK